MNACGLLGRSAQGANDQEVILGFGQDNPFPTAGFDKCAGSEGHLRSPNVEGCRFTTSAQSS